MRILLGTALLTSSIFLLHCSSDDSDDGGKAGTGAVSGAAGSSSAGTGGTGPTGSAGKGGTGATGTGGTGPTGSGGTGPTGSGGTGPTGSGGTGPTGTGGTGSTGSGGTGPTGSGGTGPTGTGGTGAGGTGAAGAGGSAGSAAGSSSGGSGGAAAFSLTSTALSEGGAFPEENTCASGEGFGSSPPLTWTAGPSSTMSYAVVLIDNDFMGGFIHWVLWDVPPTITTLPANFPSGTMPSMPAGAKQRSIDTNNGYAGPCPNGDEHEYTFTVYALPTAMLSGLSANPSTMAVVSAIEAANPLAEASLSGLSDAREPD